MTENQNSLQRPSSPRASFCRPAQGGADITVGVGRRACSTSGNHGGCHTKCDYRSAKREGGQCPPYGTAVGARNVSKVTGTKFLSEGPVPEHRDIDARIKQETSRHRSCHTSGKSGAFPATRSNPSSTSLRRVTRL